MATPEISFEPLNYRRHSFLNPNLPPQPVQSTHGTETIAPWGEPEPEEEFLPPPPIKERAKGSFSKHSLSNLRMHYGKAAPSLLHMRSSTDSASRSTPPPEPSTSKVDERGRELRKPKSGLLKMIKRQRSRPRTDEPAPSPPLNTPPIPPIISPSAYAITPMLSPKIKRRKLRPEDVPPPVPPKDPNHGIRIDMGFGIDDMNGIINIKDHPDYPGISPTSRSSMETSEEHSYSNHPSPPSDSREDGVSRDGVSRGELFINPFQHGSTGPVSRRPSHLTLDQRKVSPWSRPTQSSAGSHGPPMDSEWTAPESWAVVKVDPVDGMDPSSDDDSFVDVGSSDGRRQSLSGRKRKKTMKDSKRCSKEVMEFQIRIYLEDNSYRVLTIPITQTVATLTPLLDIKMRQPVSREAHRLYVKERGRERMLASTERPANIVRRRLEQAGYAVNDHLETLGGKDINFLIKFVYKSQVLGAPGDLELHLEEFEIIDLTGRSLRTIPIVLHQNAEQIVQLFLSGNPMLEIPLDFIQATTKMTVLKLGNMAMKKIPQSLRYSLTLNQIDASSNRVADLEDAALDRIPHLQRLQLQNNRIERLPSSFGRMDSLTLLNISNNKFQEIPTAIGEMASLKDLDVSFNLISEIPSCLGNMENLQTLTLVGNRVSRFPPEVAGLVNLAILDCRRNMITSVLPVLSLPKLETLHADYNAISSLDLRLMGPRLTTLAAQHNDITQFNLTYPSDHHVCRLTVLDISHAKLASLDESAFGGLQDLEVLRVCYNAFRFLPSSLCGLTQLKELYCSDNHLSELPENIGSLQKLEILDTHNNSIASVPVSIWSCNALKHINFTSNLLRAWPDPPASSLVPTTTEISSMRMMILDRKTSAASMGSTQRSLPALALRLERLYLGENDLSEDTIAHLAILRELRVLNLSFNDIQEIPAAFFRNLILLEELYLSGNKLTSIPTEDLHRLVKLAVLFLNGNKLQTLPAELGKISSLMVLDVGSNVLKYNINNWEFDWNWNFNENLRSLNLSGNKRLEIKPDQGQRDTTARQVQPRRVLADFSKLRELRILGLMDVTTSFGTNIPDETEGRRVRTTLSVVNQMGYGIADHLGKNENIGMFDLVKPDFRKRSDETIFAMFGRSTRGKSVFSKFLQENFVEVFTACLSELNASRGEDVRDALRRAFLRLNKQAHDTFANRPIPENLQFLPPGGRKVTSTNQFTEPEIPVSSLDTSILKSGSSGIVLYFQRRKLYVANAGDGLAVLSRQGSAKLVSRKHDPFDRSEAARIRAAEGWVSPKGLVNEEIDVSRSFGFYHLLPAVNPQPDVFEHDLRDDDEFVIVANRSLWDFVSYQTAVDIARPEFERGEPLIAAQKLRDFAISYGAEGATMIMVISVQRPALRKDTLDSIVDPDVYSSLNKRRPTREGVRDLNISRLPGEVPAPTGHVALVFTDIRNSTHLWEANPGMRAAMRIHNNLLRRQLRLRGGYEVKTEGDAFMCSFPTVLAAVYWCLEVQVLLTQEAWPLEILECEDGKSIYDKAGQLVARGLSVRMGVHAGIPDCEPDPITERMDYFGPVTIRASRISGHAKGGQILCSAEVVREIEERLSSTGRDSEVDTSLVGMIEGLRDLKPRLISVGEVKLKGMEIPESLSLLYPESLIGRQDIMESNTPADASASKVHYSIEQMRDLAQLCIRLEALSTSRVFRPNSERKVEDIEGPVVMYGDPYLLMPNIKDTASDDELVLLLDSLAMRIESTLDSLVVKHVKTQIDIEQVGVLGGVEQQMLSTLLSLLSIR